MVKRTPNKRAKRLYLIAVIILLLGLGGAILVYLTSEDAPGGGVLGYEPENSKAYMHDLELYGGKANVLAYGFLRWFDGLWHGRSLAFTIAFITICIFFGFLFIANRFPSHIESDDGHEDNLGAR